MNKIILITVAIIMCGCIGQNKKETQTDTAKLAFGTQAEISEPAPIVSLGNGNTGAVSITVPAGMPMSTRDINNTGNADLTSTYSLTTQISMAVAFLFFAIACVLLKMVFKGSKTASLTMGLVDNAMSSCVSMATTATDDKSLSMINHFKSEIADLKRHL